MAKVQRHVEIEEAHIIAIQSRFGSSVKLSYIINELLYQFDQILSENDFRLSSMLRDAAQRTVEETNLG
jgi:hypothetical protein